jgi:hypothetical protein
MSERPVSTGAESGKYRPGPETALPLWPSLHHAWRATGTGEEGRLPGEARWMLLKGEDRTRVLRLEAPGHHALVFKIYAVPGHLAWRTLGMASRANREFTVMMEAHRRGLPVAQPRYWLEQRVLGGLRYSALALDAIDGANLERLLERDETGAEERRRLAEITGDLLGRFHRAGVYWATAAPRNLLLPAIPGREPIRAIDLPYATLSSRDITGSDDALLDLACVLRMTNGDLAFDEAERRDLLRAYCAGEEAAAQAMDQRIVLRSHLSWKGRRLRRRVRNLLRPGTRSAGRGGRYRSGTGDYEPLSGGTVFFDA